MTYVFKPYVKPYTELHEMGDFVVITNARELAYFLADCKDKYRESEIINRALQSAESQVYHQITEKLKSGITVKFA